MLVRHLPVSCCIVCYYVGLAVNVDRLPKVDYDITSKPYHVVFKGESNSDLKNSIDKHGEITYDI